MVLNCRLELALLDLSRGSHSPRPFFISSMLRWVVLSRIARSTRTQVGKGLGLRVQGSRAGKYAANNRSKT